MSLQPTPAGILVEIITRLDRLIHVLQEPSGFKVSHRQEGKEAQDGEALMWLENSFLQGWGLCLFAKRNSGSSTEKQFPSPAVTQFAVVHTLLMLERNSWPGRISVNIYEKACRLFDKLHPDWDKDDVVVWNIELILNSLDPLCETGYVYVSRDSVLSLLCGTADHAVKGITVLQSLSEVQAPIWHMPAQLSPSVSCVQFTSLTETDTHLQLLSSLTHSACQIVLNWLEEADFDIRHKQIFFLNYNDNCNSFYGLVRFKQQKIQPSLLQCCICPQIWILIKEPGVPVPYLKVKVV